MNWVKNRLHDLKWIAIVGLVAGGIWYATKDDDGGKHAVAGERIESRLNDDPGMYFGPTAEEMAISINGSAEGIESP